MPFCESCFHRDRQARCKFQVVLLKGKQRTDIGSAQYTVTLLALVVRNFSLACSSFGAARFGCADHRSVKVVVLPCIFIYKALSSQCMLCWWKRGCVKIFV